MYTVCHKNELLSIHSFSALFYLLLWGCISLDDSELYVSNQI
jgi:hypothetical protein